MKIIIWGYKLYSHSHSFIHDGFYRAFSALGYDTYWFDDKDDVSNFDFSDSIFLTAVEADKGIPKRKDCRYILHNCGAYEGIGDWLNIQYLTYDSYQFEQVAPGITYKDKCLFFPWGSPLLPHEFDENDIIRGKSNDIYFLGTVNGPKCGGNYDVVVQFSEQTHKTGHSFIAGGGYTGRTKNKNITYLKGWVSKEDEASMLKTAYMAPALQGKNQLGNGMIPCRVFKAISYGNDAITNNFLVDKFFDRETTYNPDCRRLFYDADSRRNNKERIRWLFNEVKTKHTYIQRCEQIIKLL